ncbi:hypothetical protein FRC03_012265 [Tulasnella sp. 419]|nr:hypothetical protein FRC03_012265 [Tulasnella sp. 419]
MSYSGDFSPVIKRRLEEPEDIKPNIRPRIGSPQSSQSPSAGTQRPTAQHPTLPPANNQPATEAAVDNLFPAENHNELYYEDGNLILVTKDSPDGTRGAIFRVFKSQLRKQSIPLADLVDAAVHGGELFEGLPVVRMEDSTTELANLLHILWSPPPHDPSYDLLLSVLKISNKYKVDDVYQWCTRLLSEKIPITWEMFREDPSLDVFDNNVAPSQLLKASKGLNLRQFYGIAAYKLSTINWVDQPKGVRQHMIDGVSWETIVVGREELIRRILRYLYTDSLLNQTACPVGNAEQCHLPTDTGRWAHSRNESIINDPLGWTVGRMNDPYANYCTVCKWTLRRRLETFGKTLFQDLADIFEMPEEPQE